MAEADSNSTLSERNWRGVEKTLPAGADRAYVRAELELIKRNKQSPRQLLDIHDKRARSWDYLIQTWPLTDENRGAEIERVARQSEFEKKQVKFYEQMIAKNESPHFMRQCAILWLWQQQSGKDPSKYLHGDAAHYLQAASWAVLSKELKPEGAKDVIEKFRRLNFSTATLSATTNMIIDDSKVFILRDGKRIPQ
jgi:hypothetical protein